MVRILLSGLLLLLASVTCNAQNVEQKLNPFPSDGLRYFQPEERAIIHQRYFPVESQYNSSHWHDPDCCMSFRCFTARPGTVAFTEDGLHVAIILPDGEQILVSRDDDRWLAREDGASPVGLLDSRFDICFNYENKKWKFRCGYKGQALY